ncbi:MAG TPA: RES family NAD+ phosphorylase [Microvirga sp.]|nr:RES family NAD+ phosphorylase [Microvirga sp.]
MIDPVTVPIASVRWIGARRIIRSLFPPIDPFEDIADPEDWPLLITAEQKTNPRLMETLGALDLVPPGRRVAGPGATFLMAPFTHLSLDRPSRFTKGAYGVLYVAERFETALLETIHHHGRFMARTNEAPGWTSQFRELVLDIDAALHDLRGGDPALQPALDPNSYVESQALAEALRTAGSEGLVYPSQRDPSGQCAGLFYPDRTSNLIQGRHLDYHWDGTRVDLYRDAGSGEIYRIE